MNNYPCVRWSACNRKSKLLLLGSRLWAAWVLDHDVKELTIAAWMGRYDPAYAGVERLYSTITRLLARKNYEVEANGE